MTTMIRGKVHMVPGSAGQTRFSRGAEAMRIFRSKKGEQAALPEDKAANAELAFDMWDSGWDGWINSEPVSPESTQAEQPLRVKQAKIA